MKRLFLLALLASSCSVTAIKKHDPHFKSTRELQKVKGNFHVVEVRATKKEEQDQLKRSDLPCRLATFNMPTNTTVASFIRDALTDELDAAEKLSENGTKIFVTVNHLESHSASIDTGNWELDFDYLVGSKSINVKTKTEFESAYVAGTACTNTANALTDALTENFVALYKKLQK